MTNQRLYKTTIQVTVLSLEPIPSYMNLSDIHREAEYGEYSLVYDVTEEEELTDIEEIVRACEKEGTDLSFFFLEDEDE